MDKKKVKELIVHSVLQIDRIVMGDIDGFEASVDVKRMLNEALEELSKSDWVSVEERQPPKNLVVQVCNKQNPDDLVLAYRTNKETMKIVYPNNVAMYNITHWKPIEKLEE